MESFNQNAFRSDSYLLEVWYCYIDDTHVETNKEQNQEFTYHINCQNPHIKFTNDLEKDDQLQFLDTLVKRQTEVCKSVCTPVCTENPPPTDHYLAFAEIGKKMLSGNKNQSVKIFCVIRRSQAKPLQEAEPVEASRF